MSRRNTITARLSQDPSVPNAAQALETFARETETLDEGILHEDEEGSDDENNESDGEDIERQLKWEHDDAFEPLTDLGKLLGEDSLLKAHTATKFTKRVCKLASLIAGH